MHGADRVVEVLARLELECGLAFLDSYEAQAEQPRERRIGQPAVADRAKVLDRQHAPALLQGGRGIAPGDDALARHVSTGVRARAAP